MRFDGIHAQVAQLTGTVGKLVAALSKKRKHEDPESGEEDAWVEDARIAFHAVILPNHIDMIIDSGASDVLFPGKDESACTDVQLVDGILTIGDKMLLLSMVSLILSFYVIV